MFKKKNRAAFAEKDTLPDVKYEGGSVMLWSGSYWHMKLNTEIYL